MMRIPGWARNEAMPSDLYYFRIKAMINRVIKLNDKEVSYTIENGYAVLNRKWKKNDQIRNEISQWK